MSSITLLKHTEPNSNKISTEVTFVPTNKPIINERLKVKGSLAALDVQWYR